MTRPADQEIKSFIEGCYLGYTNRARAFLEKYPDCVDVRDKEGRTALLRSVQMTFSGVEVIKILLKAGASTEVFGKDGFSVLGNACCMGDIDVVKLLVEHGADIEGRLTQNKHATPLYLAAWNGKFDVVRYLVSQGASITASQGNGRSVLEAARTGGYNGQQKDRDDVIAFLEEARGIEIIKKGLPNDVEKPKKLVFKKKGPQP